MRPSLRLAGLLAATLLLAPVAWAARPALAVLPFSIDKDVVVTDGRTVLVGTVEDQTSLLTSELVQQLVASGRVDVLERARIDDVLDEKDLAAGGDGAAKAGKVPGADYLVLGRIEAMAATSERKALPYSERSELRQQARMELYLRVVDARSGRIVAAETLTSTVKLRDPKEGERIGKRLLAQAAQDIAARVLAAVFPSAAPAAPTVSAPASAPAPVPATPRTEQDELPRGPRW